MIVSAMPSYTRLSQAVLGCPRLPQAIPRVCSVSYPCSVQVYEWFGRRWLTLCRVVNRIISESKKLLIVLIIHVGYMYNVYNVISLYCENRQQSRMQNRLCVFNCTENQL